VHIKKGQFLDAHAMKFVVEKVRRGGSDRIIVTERGNSFGYSDLVVDMRNLHKLKEHGTLVGFDCTHSTQKPNQLQGVTGGSTSEEIALLARSAVAAGIDGLFMEVHPSPASGLSDAATMLSLDMAIQLLDQLTQIAKAIS
jgi:2-dehydro-3-deoxyphosphooctonate aldolase (KDO 8-P synthase)